MTVRLCFLFTDFCMERDGLWKHDRDWETDVGFWGTQADSFPFSQYKYTVCWWILTSFLWWYLSGKLTKRAEAWEHSEISWENCRQEEEYFISYNGILWGRGSSRPHKTTSERRVCRLSLNFQTLNPHAFLFMCGIHFTCNY